MKKNVLGKGLGALLPQEDSGRIHNIKISEIRSSKFQPRENFDEESIASLAQSIKENGLIQPIVVAPAGDGWFLIAGERRLRAVKEAGLEEIPAIIKDTSEESSAFLSLVENLQREDLNPVEEAKGIELLMKKFSLTQEEVAKKIGKSRPYVANILRVLKMPAEIYKALTEGQISEGQARIISMSENPAQRIKLLSKTIKEKLSVRELEKIIHTTKPKKKKKMKSSSELTEIRERLERALTTKVEVYSSSEGKGTIKIHFFNWDELDRLVRKIT